MYIINIRNRYLTVFKMYDIQFIQLENVAKYDYGLVKYTVTLWHENPRFDCT